MDLIGKDISGAPLRGGAEMRELALSALAALERADLADMARVVHERVFGLSAEALLESYDENNVRRWRFKPMAELVLREMKAVATVKDLPLNQRRRRIAWALAMAGF